MQGEDGIVSTCVLALVAFLAAAFIIALICVIFRPYHHTYVPPVVQTQGVS